MLELDMHTLANLESRDQELIQIVDSALAEAARKSGEWLVCRPGCTQCCIGPFGISRLDASRLRQGLKDLEQRDPRRATRVRERAKASVERLAPDFPGNPITGILDESPEAEERFANFANDEPCPALDPEHGTCDLYAARPMTCRVFGPPVRSEEGLGVCELCYHGATEEQIAACEMIADPDDLEQSLLDDLESATGSSGQTIVSFCLAG
jgi:Fe-S-cluster containining protein